MRGRLCHCGSLPYACLQHDGEMFERLSRQRQFVLQSRVRGQRYFVNSSSQWCCWVACVSGPKILCLAHAANSLLPSMTAWRPSNFLVSHCHLFLRRWISHLLVSLEVISPFCCPIVPSLLLGLECWSTFFSLVAFCLDIVFSVLSFHCVHDSELPQETLRSVEPASEL